MERQFKAESAGERLDKFLDRKCEDLSRARLQQLISQGLITLDDKETKASTRLREGQLIQVFVPAPVPSQLKPQRMDLDIVHEDSDILVINKRAGLVVHPSAGHPDHTLVNGVLALCPDIGDIGGTLRPGIVHRLDKDTSGLIVVAKNQNAHVYLSEQIQARTVVKCYLTLLQGKLSPEEAIIDAPIGRDPGNRKRMAVVENGRRAITKYKVIDYLEEYSHVDGTLVTGRTHQIRVHFASLNRPVVGDELYNARAYGVERQFLHASRLGVKLPSSGEYKEFASKLPSDLQSYMDSIM